MAVPLNTFCFIRVKDQENTQPLLIINKTDQCCNLSKESLELWETVKEEKTTCLLLL